MQRNVIRTCKAMGKRIRDLRRAQGVTQAQLAGLSNTGVRFISDLGTRLMAYESTEIDGMSSIPTTDMARLKAEDAGVVVSPSYGTVWYDFNCAKAPFDLLIFLFSIMIIPPHRTVLRVITFPVISPARTVTKRFFSTKSYRLRSVTITFPSESSRGVIPPAYPDFHTR